MPTEAKLHVYISSPLYRPHSLESPRPYACLIPLPNAHAHVEKYGWLARSTLLPTVVCVVLLSRKQLKECDLAAVQSTISLSILLVAAPLSIHTSHCMYVCDRRYCRLRTCNRVSMVCITIFSISHEYPCLDLGSELRCRHDGRRTSELKRSMEGSIFAEQMAVDELLEQFPNQKEVQSQTRVPTKQDLGLRESPGLMLCWLQLLFQWLSSWLFHFYLFISQTALIIINPPRAHAQRGLR